MALITFPSSPTLNQTYTAGTKTWVWNGYAWDLQTSGSGGIKYTASATAPTSPKSGDQWYFTTNDILYEYVTDGTTSFWLDVTGPTYTSSNVTTTSDSLSPFLLMGA